jgi:type I restriction enzyme R subunit
VEISQALSKLSNVPVVAQQMPLIVKVQEPNYWNGRNLTTLEELRVALRDLVKFIEYEKQEKVYTSFEDELDSDKIQVRDVVQQYQNLKGYRDRVERYLRENRDHLVIYKITHNEPITKDELHQLELILFDGNVGTKEEYVKEYGEQPLGRFIRSILGLDVEAANKAFADFINSPSLRADQMTFIQKIINYLTKNGVIEKSMLFEPPFTEQHQDGVIGLFDDSQATKIISIVDRLNQNSDVG